MKRNIVFKKVEKKDKDNFSFSGTYEQGFGYVPSWILELCQESSNPNFIIWVYPKRKIGSKHIGCGFNELIFRRRR